MKGRKIEPLARRHVLPVLPGFAARGGLVYRPPVDYVLRGLWFDTSSFTSSRIYVTAFVQPLFHSHQDLTFSYGFRLGNDFWDVDESDADPSFAAIAEEVQRHAVPFFDQVTDLDRLCALIPQWDKADPKKIMRDHSPTTRSSCRISPTRPSFEETATERSSSWVRRSRWRTSRASTETTNASQSSARCSRCCRTAGLQRQRRN